MYNIGDVIFYYSTGICRVENIGDPGVGLSTHVDYYTLQPLSANHREMIYVPVDTKAFTRPAINRTQAEEYLAMVKDLRPRYPESRNPKAVQDFYSELMQSYDSRDLLQIIVSLVAKKREVAARNKSLNQTQNSFLRRAQEMVYNEIAYALGKDRDEIADIIEKSIVVK